VISIIPTYSPPPLTCGHTRVASTWSTLADSQRLEPPTLWSTVF